MGARLLVVPTQSGSTARMVSAQHANIPILAICKTQKVRVARPYSRGFTGLQVGRQLMLWRGVYPLVDPDYVETPAEALRIARELGWVGEGDKAVMISAEDAEDDSYDPLLVTRVLNCQ